jgi:hypothetical protein
VAHDGFAFGALQLGAHEAFEKLGVRMLSHGLLSSKGAPKRFRNVQLAAATPKMALRFERREVDFCNG